jgi:hypothetical protein
MAEIFNDGFESDDFSAWDGGGEGTGGTRTTATGSALTGTYGADFDYAKTDGDGPGFGNVFDDFTNPGSGIVFLKAQIKTTRSTSGGYGIVGSKAAMAIYSGTNRMVWLALRVSGGALQVRGTYRTRGGTDTFFGDWVTIPTSTSEIKIFIDKSGADPNGGWFLDDVSQGTFEDTSGTGSDGIGRTPSRAYYGVTHVLNWEQGNYAFDMDECGVYDADPDDAGSPEEAEVAPIVVDLTIPAVTATYAAVITATVAAVLTSFTVPSVTASYDSVQSATVSPVIVETSIPSVTATFTELETYSRESAGSLPVDDSDLSTIYSQAEKTTVATADGSRVDQTGSGNVLHQFKDIGEADAAFTGTWIGQSTVACSVKTIYLQVFNRTSGDWETVDSDTTTAANTDITLSATVSSSLTDYYDSNAVVSFRVYQV